MKTTTISRIGVTAALVGNAIAAVAAAGSGKAIFVTLMLAITATAAGAVWGYTLKQERQA